MVTAPHSSWIVTWEKLPDDFILDDKPVDDISQPALAAALTHSLDLAGRLPKKALVVTNYGLCATVNGKTGSKRLIGAMYPRFGYRETR